MWRLVALNNRGRSTVADTLSLRISASAGQPGYAVDTRVYC